MTLREWTPERRAAHGATMREAFADLRLLDQEHERAADNIPALTTGRARKVTCSGGHTLIYTSVPEKCPLKGCEAPMATERPEKQAADVAKKGGESDG